MSNLRIAHPKQPAKQAAKITFTFDGMPIQAFENETIAAALFAADKIVFGSSFKYHRPRGMFSLKGKYARASMSVDGIPHQNISTTLVKQGMVVKSEREGPLMEHLIATGTKLAAPLLHGGFQYHSFLRPKFMIPFYQKMMREHSVAAELPDKNAPGPQCGTGVETVKAEVLVVGAGAGGLSAALYAAKGGAKVLVIDEEEQAGGFLKAWAAQTDGDAKGFDHAASMLADAKADPNIELRLGMKVYGYYRPGYVAAIQNGQLFKFEFDKLVVATGCMEKPPVFENNDLPGIFSSRLVLQMLNTFGVLPGKRAVVLGGDEYAQAVAAQMADCGMEVAALVSPGDIDAKSPYYALLQKAGVVMHANSAVEKAVGATRVTSAMIAKLAGDRALSSTAVYCDTICAAGSRRPTYELPALAECAMKFLPGTQGYAPVMDENGRTSNPNIFVVGEAAGKNAISAILASGSLAAAAILADLGKDGGDTTAFAEAVARDAPPAPTPFLGTKYNFICTCMDITVADVALAHKKGFSGVEILKRYLGCGTGPCQGKCCTTSLVQAISNVTGERVDTIRLTTQRPPIEPVPMGILQGGSDLDF